MNRSSWEANLRRANSAGRGSQTMREILLTIYALIAALILIRSVFLTIGLLDTLWVGNFIYSLTDILVWPLTLIPGSDTAIVNDFEFADLAMLALVVSVPFALVGSSRRR